jgi:hypothetical protein
MASKQAEPITPDWNEVPGELNATCNASEYVRCVCACVPDNKEQTVRKRQDVGKGIEKYK